MRYHKKIENIGLTQELINQWDYIDPMVLPENCRDDFLARVNAIKLYAKHETTANIRHETGICRQELYRLIKRTLTLMPDGTEAGFRGIIPHRHLAESRYSNLSNLKSRKPLPGALTALFSKFPSIYRAMKAAAVDGTREGIKVREPDMAVAILHEYFIDLCDRAGIKSPHYPFVESSDEPAGLPAIRRWTQKVRTEEVLKRMRCSGIEEEIRAAYLSGPQNTSLRPASELYQRIEFDGHKIDAPFAIEVPSPRGEGTVLIKIDRIWIIVGIEVRSHAVVGYSLALGTNYSSRDLVRAVRNCLGPWRPRDLTVNTVGYGAGDGIPSGVIDELAYACFTEIAFDNAMAHRAEFLLSYLERTIQCVPIWSPVKALNAHPYIEGFFHLLEECGIHRMPTTHGSHPKDRRRRGKIDERYLLSYDLLADLIDLLVCKINGSKAPGCSQTPLELLQNAVRRRSFIIRHVPVDLRSQLMAFDICQQAQIGRDHGRPVIRFEGARYRNKTLKLAANLIGRTVTIFANSRNLQVIEVSLDDGTSLGEMLCEPRWASTPHSLDTRREINREATKGQFVVYGDNIVTSFNKHLESTAITSKRSARMLARLRAEQAEMIKVEENSSNVSSEELRHDYEINSDLHDDESELEAVREELNSLTTVYRISGKKNASHR